MRVLGCLLAVLVLLGAVACGGSSGPEKGAESAGFTSYTVEGKFTVSIPSDWKAFTDEQLQSIDLSEFVEENPAFEGINVDDYAMLAADPDATDLPTTFNVIVQEGLPEGRQIEDDVDAALSSIATLPIVEGSLNHEIVTLPAGRALYLEYTLEATFGGLKKGVATRQYGLYSGDRSFILTFACAPSQADALESTFQRSAESFRVEAS